MAERERFELSVQVDPVRRFSKNNPSFKYPSYTFTNAEITFDGD